MSVREPYVLGIDLGTTFTAAAVGRRDGVVEIATLGTRAAAIPSVLLFRTEGVLAGDAAEDRARSEPERVARLIKRRLGDSVPMIVDGRPYSPESLLATLLRWVVAQVARTEGAPPSRVAVCHPANWGPYKLELFRQALVQAELPDAVLVPEPIAAAVSYASTRALPVGGVVAVYDLGGGTFDASVVRHTPAGFELVGTPGGIEHLGGVDIDAAVLAHVTKTVGPALSELDPDDPAVQAAVARLREDCVRAKEVLSSDTVASIPVIVPGLATEVRLTRAELEHMIRPMIGESVNALRRAVTAAGVESAELTSVLLVGGSSRIPLVAELVTAELGVPVAVDIHPKHATAIGAVLVATGAGAAPPPDAPPPAADLPAAPPPPPPPSGYTGPTEPIAAPLGAAPTGPPPDKRRRAVALLAVFALVAAGAAAYLVLGDDDEAQAAEVFAEPVASIGVDPFTDPLTPTEGTGVLDEILVGLEPPAGQPSGFDLPTISVPTSGGATPQVSGAAPGLYGGTNQAAVCDKGQLVSFLTATANADKARAWADVLDIAVEDIPAYIAGLTDVVLQRDIRVTNHGFKNGRATTLQSVLQAGSAVMIDRFGVPRVRCKCGNPLTPPTPLPSRTPRVEGVTWIDFDLTQVIVIAPSPQPIEIFVLDDLLSTSQLRRPAGSDFSEAVIVGDESSTTTTTGSTTSTSTSTTVVLGTGDVQVTLIWSSDSDLDLHVVDPAGAEINFTAPSSTSGGQLDVDNIPTAGDASTHVENVFWPTGGAPPGNYQAWVVGFAGTTTGYRLEIKIGGELVDSEDGTIEPGETTAPIAFTVTG